MKNRQVERMCVRAGLVGLLALVLAACSSSGSTPAAGLAAADDQPDAASCQAHGGQLQALGRLQRVQCVVAYADAGKACSDSSQCSGLCLSSDDQTPAGQAVGGTCQRDASENFGCRQPVEGGVAGAVRCVD
jgi:hypothetical protein